MEDQEADNGGGFFGQQRDQGQQCDDHVTQQGAQQSRGKSSLYRRPVRSVVIIFTRTELMCLGPISRIRAITLVNACTTNDKKNYRGRTTAFIKSERIFLRMPSRPSGWQAGLANIRDEDLMMCCTKSSSITQAGSEVDFLFSPRATGRTPILLSSWFTT
ncbi:hypothetical protein EYF80_011540 [Liparis tanakae]|uniref:Uncharacterized protein n=1 Tax=Liparis tanakae TaxID=230148 RepID=A0A4Z2IJW9_9TELE|nr:hypothetical protein EYF80_011540 [Liparis tanakae]